MRITDTGAFIRARVWLTRRLCRCDEIECSRCTVPWIPIEQRSKRELVEDYHELKAHNEELRRRLDIARLATDGKIIRIPPKGKP